MDLHPAWHEAAASVQADVDKDLRAEAYDLFRAETARTRLCDRPAAPGSRMRIVVRSGTAIAGVRADDDHAIEGTLALIDDAGRLVLIPTYAVVTVSGLAPGLRAELPESTCAWTIAARLREAAEIGEAVAVLLQTGLRVAGGVDRVGADHVDLDRGSAGLLGVPFAAVDAWYLAA